MGLGAWRVPPVHPVHPRRRATSPVRLVLGRLGKLGDMTDLPMPEPRPFLSDSDVRAVLDGLQPGVYLTRDLYPRYEAWARREGKRIVSRNMFGTAMARVVERAGNAGGHVSAWIVGPISKP